MDKSTFTIDGKEYTLKKITVGEWLEMSKVYDEFPKYDETNVGYIEARCKIVSVLFGITEEEIKTMPAETVTALYFKGAKEFQNMIASKMSEKKSEEENPAIEV